MRWVACSDLPFSFGHRVLVHRDVVLRMPDLSRPWAGRSLLHLDGALRYARSTVATEEVL